MIKKNYQQIHLSKFEPEKNCAMRIIVRRLMSSIKL